MADLDYRELHLSGQLRRLCWRQRGRASALRQPMPGQERVAELRNFVRRFAANKSRARQATSRLKQIDQASTIESAVIARAPVHPLRAEQGAALAVTEKEQARRPGRHQRFSLTLEAGRRSPSSGPTVWARPRCCACWRAISRRHRRSNGRKAPIWAAWLKTSLISSIAGQPVRLAGRVRPAGRRRSVDPLGAGPAAVFERRDQQGRIGAFGAKRTHELAGVLGRTT